MKEFVEKLIGRLKELTHDNPMITRNYILRKDAIEIVNQLAEGYKHCDLCYLGSPCEYQNPEISCEKCIEYDTEEHCCPKFCKVITDTIQEMKEEHHNNDFCEWFKYDYRTIAPKSHDAENPYWRIPENLDKLKFCPYCGKKIKVVPYQPKGE